MPNALALPEPRAFLRSLFDAAVAAADPRLLVPRHLPEPAAGRTIVVGAGKASAAMAAAFEAAWDGLAEGLVVTRYGHAVPCRNVEIVEADHPVPDEAGLAATRRILELVSGLTPDDLVVALISGGGSALMTEPLPGIGAAEKQAITSALLKSGATIGQMNCVRKHLSAVKGGRLALAAQPARIHAMLISDVPGDDPAVIASGPTVPDPTSQAEALAILEHFAIPVSDAVRAVLADPSNETPKPGDPAFARCQSRIIAAPQMSLEAAAEAARTAGITPLILGDAIEGEAREVGIVHAGIARQVARHGQPVAPPAVILSGGETTVTVRGAGRGGRNAEFLLGLALALEGRPAIHAIACDTDGIDGLEDNAGALLAPDSLARMRAGGLDPRAALAANDAYSAFAAIGDLVVTGPTLTNVNDFRGILIAI
jgi:glycerate 2-kinase